METRLLSGLAKQIGKNCPEKETNWEETPLKAQYPDSAKTLTTADV